MTIAVVVIAVHMPIARPWAAPRKVEVISASELGTRNAAAAPWKPRAMMRNSGSGAAATAIEAMPKPIRPMRMTRMRPNASLTEPATRIRAPKVIRYESTTHCWVISPPPSSSSIAGRATLTTVPSRKATNDASAAIQTTSRCGRVIAAILVSATDSTYGARGCAGSFAGAVVARLAAPRVVT